MTKPPAVATVETYASWTIPSFPVAMRQDIVAAAAARQMKVGAFMEMVWKSYLADGSPMQVGHPIMPATTPGVLPETLIALAHLAEATRAMATAAGVTPPAALAKHLLALTSAQARSARGLRPRTKALAAPAA